MSGLYHLLSCITMSLNTVVLGFPALVSSVFPLLRELETLLLNVVVLFHVTYDAFPYDFGSKKLNRILTENLRVFAFIH